MNAHLPGNLHSLQLGRVVDNADPENRGRLRVRLISTPMEVWASVVAPSAGNGYGASFIPRLEEIVVLAFVNPELPLVLGSLWSGGNSRPEEAEPQEEHYVVRTPQGTVLHFDDSGEPQVTIRTRSGYRVTVSEGSGGEIVVERGEQSVTLSPAGIALRTSGTVSVDASSVTVNAPTVTVNASMSCFSGVVQADTVIATSVVGTSYSPGAGNIW